MAEHRMGAWGTAIFSDDLACDVRDAYRDLLVEGHSGQQATKRLIDQFAQEIKDDASRVTSIAWITLFQCLLPNGFGLFDMHGNLQH
jgi:hypothetical protein